MSDELRGENEKLKREIEELHKVLKSYDDVVNSLPSWLKTIIVMANPLAYNGASKEELRVHLSRAIEHHLKRN